MLGRGEGKRPDFPVLQSLLAAVGVGAQNQLPAAATINWLLKDGLGRLGRLSVAASFGQSFDSDLKVCPRACPCTQTLAFCAPHPCSQSVSRCHLRDKDTATPPAMQHSGLVVLQRFRWLTSLIFSSSIALEYLTPLLPRHFLLLASLSNVGKSVGVTTYVATHPAFMRSFARGENLADINAKGQVRDPLCGVQ